MLLASRSALAFFTKARLYLTLTWPLVCLCLLCSELRGPPGEKQAKGKERMVRLKPWRQPETEVIASGPPSLFSGPYPGTSRVRDVPAALDQGSVVNSSLCFFCMRTAVAAVVHPDSRQM